MKEKESEGRLTHEMAQKQDLATTLEMTEASLALVVSESEQKAQNWEKERREWELKGAQMLSDRARWSEEKRLMIAETLKAEDRIREKEKDTEERAKRYKTLEVKEKEISASYARVVEAEQLLSSEKERSRALEVGREELERKKTELNELKERLEQEHRQVNGVLEGRLQSWEGRLHEREKGLEERESELDTETHRRLEEVEASMELALQDKDKWKKKEEEEREKHNLEEEALRRKEAEIERKMKHLWEVRQRLSHLKLHNLLDPNPNPILPLQGGAEEEGRSQGQ